MTETEIRLECLKEVLRTQDGDIDRLVEAAAKVSDFVISGVGPKSHQGNPRKD